MPARAFLAALATVGAALCGTAAAAQSVTYGFDWQGSGGYSMRGALAFSADLAGAEAVHAGEVQCFVVEGYHDGRRIGRWALGQLTEETTWTLTFDPSAEAFVVFSPSAPMPQAWNMNGFGTDCGPGGFGFNIGNAAQDLCLDGTLLVDSQVTPSRPFPAQRVKDFPFPADACAGVMILSSLP